MILPIWLLQVKILSMFDHPNIISYYDNFEEDGVLMIEMEYADGGWGRVRNIREKGRERGRKGVSEEGGGRGEGASQPTLCAHAGRVGSLLFHSMYISTSLLPPTHIARSKDIWNSGQTLWVSNRQSLWVSSRRSLWVSKKFSTCSLKWWTHSSTSTTTTYYTGQTVVMWLVTWLHYSL